MPNTFDSTQSTTPSIFSAKISSRLFFRRRRGAMRSAGTSLKPSGIQMLLSTGEPSSAAIRPAMRRQRRPCYTQNARTASSGEESVRLSLTIGCEKYVGLKSMPKPCCFANATHGAKCSYSIASRSTGVSETR